MDHTLWDFEKNSALAFETIFKKHELSLELDRFLHFYVPTNLKYWKLYREEKISQEELRYKRLKEVFDLMQQEVDDSIIHLLSKRKFPSDNMLTFSPFLSSFRCSYPALSRPHRPPELNAFGSWN